MTGLGLLRNRRLVITAILMLVLIIGILTAEILAAGREGMDTIISDAASIVCSSIASVFFIRTWLSTSESEIAKRIWGLAALGIVLWTLAEIIWGFYEVVLGRAIPYPSIADLFWLGGYVPLYLALSTGYRTFQARTSRQQMLAIALSILIFSAASIIFVIVPTLRSFDPAKLPESLTNVAYPLADSALVILTLIIIFALEKGRFAFTWQLFGIGLIFSAIGDLTFSYATWNELYYPGNQLNFLSGFIDTLFNISYLTLGMAAYSYRLLSETLSTGKINLVLRSLTRSNILVFISCQGKILSLSDNFSNLIGTPAKTSFIEMPLSEALGLNESEVENIIRETVEHGSLSTRPLKVRNSNGSARDTWWTSLAIYDEQHQLDCIALVLRANLAEEARKEPPLKEDQRMLIEYYLSKAGANRIEEDQVIKSYFIEQINLLHSLVEQFSGGKMAKNLLAHLQQAASRNNWYFSLDGQDITIPKEFEGQVLGNFLFALLQEAKKFAVDMTSLKLVEQEMASLDRNMGPEALRDLDKYNLRSLIIPVQ